MYNISRKYALSDSRLLCSHVEIVLYSKRELSVALASERGGIHNAGNSSRSPSIFRSFCNCQHIQHGNMVPGRIPPSAVGIARSVQRIRIFDNNVPAGNYSEMGFLEYIPHA